MQLFHLLALATAVIALPQTKDLNTKRDTCNSQEWNIQQYTAFTAGSTSPAGGPPAFSNSHISFKFADPNFNIQNECSVSANTGEGLDSLVGNTYPCDGGNMYFQYFGSSITLKRTGVPCGDVTYTETGSTSLSLNCYSLFGGTQCETVTQTNVPISFLEQTG
ncbi:hypothetical protein ACLMJK_008463 [Lecanora helva]